MDIVKINGTKVRLCDIRYGSDEAQTLTWAAADAMVFKPVCGWYSLGKVRATVKLQENDAYNFGIGCTLALNILERKAIARFVRQLEKEQKEDIKYLEAKRTLAEALVVAQHELELKFKELA